MHRKINLDYTPQSKETQQALDKLYKEKKKYFHYRRPEEAMFDNWQKLVSTQKSILFLRNTLVISPILVYPD